MYSLTKTTHTQDGNGVAPTLASTRPSSTSPRVPFPALTAVTAGGTLGAGNGEAQEGRQLVDTAGGSGTSMQRQASPVLAAGQTDLSVARTQQEENQLLERSRLKTLRKGLEGYGGRLTGRLEASEAIPLDEVALIPHTDQMAASLCREVGNVEAWLFMLWKMAQIL